MHDTLRHATMAVIALVLFGGSVTSQAEAKPEIDKTRAQQAEAAVRKGAEWLIGKQAESGAWSNPDFPAITALACWALMRSDADGAKPAVAKGLEYVASCASSGGIFKGAIYRPVRGKKGGGLVNYNTALCMVALHASGLPKYRPLVLNARTFLARSQYLGKGMHHGGMGYDPPTGRDYADLSNSFIGYEAMHLTRDVEEARPGDKKVNLDWEAALRFVQSCHNDPRFNKRSWASDDPSERGGFAYRPDTYRENSGAYEKDGVLKFRSMPGMTYAGLLSYIYAGVNRSDPRVQATVNWIRTHWQLEKGNRNPDMAGKPEEKEGLYYMYNVLAKGLDAFGRDVLADAEGRKFNWRNELIAKLVELRKEEGFWINENGRYWEADPVLVTSYVLLSLETALGR